MFRCIGCGADALDGHCGFLSLQIHLADDTVPVGLRVLGIGV